MLGVVRWGKVRHKVRQGKLQNNVVMRLWLLQSYIIVHYYVRFLVATLAFPQNRRHSTLPQPERHTVLKGSDNVRAPHVRSRGSGYRGDDGELARTHVCHCFWLAALLRRRALRGPLRLRRHHWQLPIRGKIHTIFF